MRTNLVSNFDDPLLHPARDDRSSSRNGENILDWHQEGLVQRCTQQKQQQITRKDLNRHQDMPATATDLEH